MLYGNHKHPIFLKSLFGVATILSFGLYLFFRGVKEKSDFVKVTGKVIYYSDDYLKENHPYKYLQIDNYPRVFALILPKDSFNESYIFKYNEIKLGDALDLYFDENTFEKDQRVNRAMRFIDKNKKIIFLSNRNDKTAGLCFIGIGLTIMITLIVLKQKGKII